MAVVFRVIWLAEQAFGRRNARKKLKHEKFVMREKENEKFSVKFWDFEASIIRHWTPPHWITERLSNILRFSGPCNVGEFDSIHTKLFFSWNFFSKHFWRV